jgi:hypothetical protein
MSLFSFSPSFFSILISFMSSCFVFFSYALYVLSHFFAKLYPLVYKNSVRTSQETHYVSATETNRLMLFREIIAVYCENRTEHTDPVRTSQETHYVAATESNRLMLFKEIIAVYCGGTHRSSSYLTGNTSRLRYKAQPVNAV